MLSKAEFDHLAEQAKQGEAEAQYRLGYLYWISNVWGPDLEQAHHWLSEAAKQDHPAAMSLVGMMHLSGRGAPADEAEGLALVRKASLLGSSEARDHLALREAAKLSNDPEAPSRLLALAQQGDANAMNWLGHQNEYQNPQTALDWHQQAAGLGHAESAYTVGYLLEKRFQRPASEAYNWYLKAANLGDSRAQIEVGLMNETGRGTPENSIEAIEWYRKAADQGDVSARYLLGLRYLNGVGTDKDAQKALDYLKEAAFASYKAAQLQLAHIYEDGKDVPRDMEAALLWYREAAGAGVGSDEAMFKLGQFYELGQGVPQDYETAHDWYTQAAEEGYVYREDALNAARRLVERRLVQPDAN